MIPLHLGTLHPVEQVLTIVLAFGPFLLLGLVIAYQRRKDAQAEAEEAREAAADGAGDAEDRVPSERD